MTIKIEERGRIPIKGEEGFDKIQSGIKEARTVKLKEIELAAQKKAATSGTLKESKDVTINKPTVYGISDNTDPKHDTFFQHLEIIRRTNPSLYKKMISLD